MNLDLRRLELLKSKVAAGLYTGSIVIFSFTNQSIYMTLTGHNGTIRCLEQVGNSILASGSEDKSIILWNTTTGQSIMILNRHTDFVLALEALNSYQFVSGSADKSLIVWNLFSGQIAQNVANAHSNSINSLRLLQKSGKLASASSDNTIKIWNINPISLLTTLNGHILDVKLVLAVYKYFKISDNHDFCSFR